MSINWVYSAGGPLICSTAKAGSEWRGVHGSSTGSAHTDYERSCEVHDYQGVIPCGASAVLVLSDEPLQSAFVKVGREVAVARWVSCVSMKRAEYALAALPSQLRAIGEPVELVVSEPSLFMFDSALDRPLAGAAGACCVDVRPGRYEVAVESYRLEQEFEFLIHRLRTLR